MKQKKSRLDTSNSKKQQLGPRNRPYQKTTGKSISDEQKHRDNKNPETPRAWEYPEESAEVKQSSVHPSGGYKQHGPDKGYSAVPDDDEEDDMIPDNEYIKDDDDEF
jgi:hypothetical protein